MAINLLHDSHDTASTEQRIVRPDSPALPVSTDTVKLPSEKFVKQDGGPIEVQNDRKQFLLSSAEELYADIRSVVIYYQTDDVRSDRRCDVREVTLVPG